jgi:hypothetical protein
LIHRNATVVNDASFPAGTGRIRRSRWKTTRRLLRRIDARDAPYAYRSVRWMQSDSVCVSCGLLKGNNVDIEMGVKDYEN